MLCRNSWSETFEFYVIFTCHAWKVVFTLIPLQLFDSIQTILFSWDIQYLGFGCTGLQFSFANTYYRIRHWYRKPGRWKHRRLHEDKFRSNWQVSTGPVFARMNKSLLDTQISNPQSHSSLIDLEHTISEYKSMGWTWSKHTIYMYQILSWQKWRKITWKHLHSITASFIHPCS